MIEDQAFHDRAADADPVPSFYVEEEDGLFLPTNLARSPWQRSAQNGVALGGLAAAQIDRVTTPVPMITSRLTIDILAAAPHAPTRCITRIVREGGRLQLVEAELLIDDRPVARATALRARSQMTPLFDEPSTYPSPDICEPYAFMNGRAFGGRLETRLVHGGPGSGAAALWVRFDHQHVAGRPLSPLVRTASLADFGGGLGSVLDKEEWTYANLDISVHMLREARGEWLLCDATTASHGNGVGRSDMILADEQGAFARAHQTLFIALR